MRLPLLRRRRRSEDDRDKETIESASRPRVRQHSIVLFPSLSLAVLSFCSDHRHVVVLLTVQPP